MRSERDLIEEILSLTRAIHYNSKAGIYDSIDRLNLTKNVRDILATGNILSVGDLVQLTEVDLLKSYAISRKYLYEIKEVLMEHGFHLGMKRQ